MINSSMHQNCFQVYLTSVFYPVENPYSYEFSGKDVIDVVAQTKQVKSNALQLDIKPLFIFENLKSKKKDFRTRINSGLRLRRHAWNSYHRYLLWIIYMTHLWLIHCFYILLKHNDDILLMARNQWRYNDVIEDVVMTSFDFIPG